MRVSIASVFLLVLAVSLTACDDDPFARLDPLVVTDTVDLVAINAPEALGPAALDITAQGGVIIGGRDPSRVEHAGQWDLAVRRQDGQLVFLGPTVFGFETRAGVTRPLEGTTFDALRDVPIGARFVTDSAVVIQPGAVYVARSRDFVLGFFGGCVQYAKLQPLVVDVAAGAVRLQIATNERCFDTRLVNAGG